MSNKTIVLFVSLFSRVFTLTRARAHNNNVRLFFLQDGGPLCSGGGGGKEYGFGLPLGVAAPLLRACGDFVGGVERAGGRDDDHGTRAREDGTTPNNNDTI